VFALFVMVAPLVVGFVIILFIARYAPNVPRGPELLASGRTDDRAQITGDEFDDLVQELLAALGLETVFSSMGTGGVVEMTLRDPKPLTGGRILLHATPVLQGQIDAVDVLGFAEGVRADMGALKGIMIALAGFTDEARVSVDATPAPVDLIDGAQLLELVREQLGAARAEAVACYRGFGSCPSPRRRDDFASEPDGPASSEPDGPASSDEDS